MTGETHRAGGMLASVVGFWLLKKNNLLIPDVNEGLQLLIMYPFTMWGSVASDLDHHWESCPSKDAPSWAINKVLHLTTGMRSAMDGSAIIRKSLPYHIMGVFDAGHRSWQTHSDLTLVLIIGLLWGILTGHIGGALSVIDITLLALIITGLGIGVIAHLLLDMFTPQGVWSTVFVGLNKLINLIARKKINLLPEKIHFVPYNEFFSTGGAWERFIYKVLRVSTVISVLYILILLIFPNGLSTLFPYEITFNY